MSIAVLTKKPHEKFPVGLIYVAPDLEEGKSLTGAEVTISPIEESGLKKHGNIVVETDRISQMIEAGLDGHEYYVIFKVTTSVNHIYEDSILIKVRNILEEEA